MLRIFNIICLFTISMFSFFCSERKEEKKTLVETTEAKVDKRGKLIIDLSLSKTQKHTEDAAKIESLLEKHHKLARFNAAVLVGEDGKIIYAKGWGYSDFANKKPLSTHSSFHLASVSKQFTAMAIMILKEEGKLSYDDTIRKFLPELPYQGVTIRQLLTHTSGIPNILNYIPNYMKYWDSCAIAGNEDVVYMLQRHRPPVSFRPGKRFSYNNTGYVLLAVIVERVAKMPFEKFMETRIFEPLSMEDTKVYSMINEPRLKDRVYGYGQRRSYFSMDEDDIRNGLTGEKGIYSSVIDLYKWDRALYTDYLVTDSTLSEAFTGALLDNGKQIRYGFGWRKTKQQDQIVYHFGHWRGFNSCIIRFTADQKVIIILNNTGSKRLKHLAQEIIKILYSNQAEHPDLD